MATLDELLVKVTDANARVDSLIVLFQGLKQQLADALSGVTLPATAQAKVDAIFQEITTQAAEVDEALNENVPPPTP